MPSRLATTPAEYTSGVSVDDRKDDMVGRSDEGELKERLPPAVFSSGGGSLQLKCVQLYGRRRVISVCALPACLDGELHAGQSQPVANMTSTTSTVTSHGLSVSYWRSNTRACSASY